MRTPPYSPEFVLNLIIYSSVALILLGVLLIGIVLLKKRKQYFLKEALPAQEKNNLPRDNAPPEPPYTPNPFRYNNIMLTLHMKAAACIREQSEALSIALNAEKMLAFHMDTIGDPEGIERAKYQKISEDAKGVAREKIPEYYQIMRELLKPVFMKEDQINNARALTTVELAEMFLPKN